MDPAACPLPPPSHPFADNHHSRLQTQPLYPEMIIAAITATKGREGWSSREKMAKYITSVYTNLPSNHRTLLTWHLQKMKAEGALFMVKHSYALPGSVPVPQRPETGTPPTPPTRPKRGPRRFHKPKTPANRAGVGPEARPNVETVFVSLGLVDGPADASPARGRPPRAKSEAVRASGPEKRDRGRPPRLVREVVAASAEKLAVPSGRPRGRPTKAVVADDEGGAAAVVAGDGGAAAAAMVGAGKGIGMKRPRRLSGKPLGRPKKDASVPATQVAAQHLVAYQYMKNKLERFQSRVKHAVHLVRPYFTNETAPYVYGALQELEELANTDMTAP